MEIDQTTQLKVRLSEVETVEAVVDYLRKKGVKVSNAYTYTMTAKASGSTLQKLTLSHVEEMEFRLTFSHKEGE